MRDNDPESWSDAVAMDVGVRTGLSGPGFKGSLYLHRSCVPLEEVDLSTPAERGSPPLFDVDGFGNECEGMCGL